MSSRPASNIREFAPAPASTVEDGDLDLLAAILSRTQSPAASRAAAADLIADFGGLADVAAADEAALLRAGLATAAVADLLRIRALAVAMARAEACHRPVLSSWTALTTYLRADMAHAPREQFRVLYLDRRNILIVRRQRLWHRSGVADNGGIGSRRSDVRNADETQSLQPKIGCQAHQEARRGGGERYSPCHTPAFLGRG